jgi:protein SCO1/2
MRARPCPHPNPLPSSTGEGMTPYRVSAILLAGVFLIVICCSGPARAETQAAQDNILSKVGFTQNLGAQIPLNLKFRNEVGQYVPLSTYFGQKPVILNLVYYQCPMLCTEVLNGTTRTMRAMPLKLGSDFNVVTVSFDPRDTPALATDKKRVYLDRYGHPGGEKGWAFLTGTETSIKALADAVGFHFAYDPQIHQFAHPSGIVILTPQGKIARYYFGVEYPTQDVRLSLVEASSGSIGTPVDKVILYCYRYDPTTGRYGLLIMRVIQLGAVLTVFFLAVFIIGMLLHERAANLRTRNA